MMKIVWDSGFKKNYKKKMSHSFLLKKCFWNSLDLFIKNPFDKRLRTHKLSGELKDCWAFSINYKYRIVFEFIDDNTALLIDIGTHDEVY